MSALFAGSVLADEAASSTGGLTPFVQSLERSEREARERLAQAERQLDAAARLVAQSRDALAAQSPAEPVRFAITVPYGRLEAATPDGGWRAVDPTSALPVQDGARLRTARGAQAELVLAAGDSRVLLDRETEVTAHDAPDRSWLDLARGRLYLLVKQWSKQFQVRTPAAVFGVRGTEFAVTADAQGGTTLVVLSGIVEARAGQAPGEPLEVRGGQRLVLRPDGNVETVQTVDARTLDAWWHGNP
ncbi:MAG: FecR domain-containing protein [Burkholderiaceae bacterium]